LGVSRQTVGRVLERGRGKVADALVGGKAIVIGGGQYRVEPRQLCCSACLEHWVAADGESAPATCPQCGSTDVGICWGPGSRCIGEPGSGRGRHGGGNGPHGPACGRGTGRGHGGGAGPGPHGHRGGNA
jgi:hypothetical protein